MFYTIGQRQGLRIGGVSGTPEDAWYVADKDISNNELVVVQGGDHPALMSSGLSMGLLHFINGEPEESSFVCMAKTRYRQPDQTCKITKTDGGWHVSFDNPQRAVTPGQSLVLYLDDHCLGGGVIESTEPL